jgi:phosphopentomutase
LTAPRPSCRNFCLSIVPVTKKSLLIVLDGVGIGELPDADRYGDRGSNTLVNTAEAVGGLRLPNLAALGLGNITPIKGVQPAGVPKASFGKLAEKSRGKDSTTGHWELCGLALEREFPTFPDGFPAALMDRFLRETGCDGYLGNTVASGTTIIQELGDDHGMTGYPIVYTSADSVFQIAAHEDVIPLQRLYEICELTRGRVCIGEYEVGRVIARPFIGSNGQYTRTLHRKDFSLDPSGMTVLDVLSKAGIATVGIGKVDDLFNRRGLQRTLHTRTNAEGLEASVRFARELGEGFLIANLGDFDTLYGHRNDPRGFARALEEFDRAVPELLGALSDSDLLLITADHGNDPVTPSTDHSREYVPLLCFRRSRTRGTNLGTRQTFADVGKTVAEFFMVPNALSGTSFLWEVV